MKREFFLLADDDSDDAELFGEALASLDRPVRFHRVRDGEEVLSFLNDPANKRPDIIFLDLNMTGMSGWQCLSRLKNDKQLSGIPVIMYTTSSNVRDKEIAADLGAEGFVTKPTDFKILKKLLKGIADDAHNDLKKSIREIFTL